MNIPGLERQSNGAGARFDVVVLNHELVHLFLDNFHKIRNFDPPRDRIVVLDCSRDSKRERDKVESFARAQGWKLGGPEIVFVTRVNWGIDQGGRIDYLSSLHATSNRAPYVWQFQDHFLDTTSPYARYADWIEDVGGTIKEDIIPDGMDLDLDRCERAFADPEVSVVFASRLGLRVFLHSDGQTWFFADGGNLAFRTANALRGFSPFQLDDYRLVFDASYRWAGFFEFEFGRCLSNGAWHDLESGRTWRDWAHVQGVEQAEGRRIATPVEPRFTKWVARYHGRIPLVRALPSSVRETMLKTAFPAVSAFQRHVFFPVRGKLRARGIHSPMWMREIW